MIGANVATARKAEDKKVVINKKRVMLIGSSHLRALVLANEKITKERNFEFVRTNMNSEEFNGWCYWEGNDLVIPRWVGDKLREKCKRYNPQRLVLSVGGSEYFHYSALAPIRDFDFFVPEDDDCKDAEAHEIVPYELVRNLLRRHMSHVNKLVEICSSFAIQIDYLDTPPPSPSDDLFKSHLPANLAEHVDVRGLGRSNLRRKMWLTQRSINAEICSRHGVNLLPVPASAIGPNLMMRSDFRDDAFHGGPGYGDLVLDQIDAIVGQEF